MIEAGTYRARPTRGGLGKTSTGKEQIAIEFELLTDPPARITWYGYFTEKTFERTIESLRAIGWTGDSLTDFAAGGTLPPGCEAEVEIVVEHEQDQNGEWRARVRWINSGGGLAMKEQLAGIEAQAFAERMRGRILAMSQGQRPAAAPAPRQRPQTRADSRPPDDYEDVPF